MSSVGIRGVKNMSLGSFFESSFFLTLSKLPSHFKYIISVPVSVIY